MGLGTNSPESFANLHIEETSGNAALLLEGSDRATIILADNTGGTGDKNLFIRNDEQNLLFGHFDDAFGSADEKMRLDSNGRLGVGTVGPTHSLHVYDATDNSAQRNDVQAYTGGITIQNQSQVLDAFAALRFNFHGDDSYYLKARRIANNNGEFEIGQNYSSTNTDNIAIKIDNSRNVGIGTTIPGTELHVQGSNGYAELRLSGNSGSGGTIEFYESTTKVADIFADTSNNIVFRNTTEALRIDSNGQIGIGTNNPQQFVHIHDEGNSGIVTTRIQQVSSNTPTDGGAFLQLGGTRSTGTFGHYGGIFGGRRNQAGDNTGYLAFHVDNNDGESMSERVRITHQGRVGIGSDNPQAFLVIQGDSNDSTLPSIRLQDGTDARQVQITNTSGDFLVKTCGSDNNTHGSFKIFESGIIALSNGGASGSNVERLRIDTNGNFIFKNGALIENGFHDDGGGLTGDYNHDLGTYGNVHFSATNAAGSFTYNLRINSSTTLNSVMAEGDVLSFTLMHASDNTSRYMTQLKIDGSNVSPVWAGGSAPSAATGSGFDVYSFSIMKTGNNSYGIFGSFTNHA